MRNAVCRKCRREGVKLFLKGEKCLSPKCPLGRRSYPPGIHGQLRRPKLSDYGKQLREKQKAKRIYGVREQQFQNYFDQAAKHKETSGERLLQLLERRLDNVVYRLGFASSRQAARQLVSHGHILVNGKRVDRPSFQARPKDLITPKETDKIKLIKTEMPAWLRLDKKKLQGEIVKIPSKEELPKEINKDLIVEFYSR